MENRYFFRAKRIDNGEWVEGQLFQRTYEETGEVFEAHIIIDAYEQLDVAHFGIQPVLISPLNDDCLRVDPSTICQCTGLKDKNGKLIWENDIVVYYDMTEEKYLISWESNKACYEYQQYGCSMMNFDELSGCEIEILGNIFDNPELLEVGA